MGEPDLSVVVPTARRPETLKRCLRGLSNQTSSPDTYEVIVVRLVETPGEPKQTNLPNGARLKHVTITDPVPGMARNKGTSFAEADVVAFIDDDCVAAEDWVEKIRLRFETANSDELAAVGGAVEPLGGTGNLVDRYLSHVEHLNGPITEDGEIVNMASANLSVDREYFNRVGGFDERLKRVGAEDQNLISRLRKIGDVDFDDGILVYHDHEIGFLDFLAKFRGYGYGVYEHYQLSDEEPPDDGVYRPRCANVPEVVRESPRLLGEAVAEVTENGTDSPYLPVFVLLAFLKKVSFQVGAMRAHEKYETYSRSFVFE